jgi:hypothetical protein
MGAAIVYVFLNPKQTPTFQRGLRKEEKKQWQGQ